MFARWRLPGQGWCILLMLAIALSIVLAGEVAGQQNPPSQPNAAQSGFDSHSPSSPAHSIVAPGKQGQSDLSLKLGPGDLLDISVYAVPELSTKARVSNAGDLYLPLIDYVHVGDLTIEETQSLIQKRLTDGGFLKNPHVSVFVVESTSQGVTVLGEVTKPGAYPVVGGRRLYDVVSAAGGFTEKAGRTVTITHRDKPEEPITIHLPNTLTQSSESNVQVSPGDTLIVSRAGIVYVVGAVGRPSGFMLEDNNLTVLKALALAGGSSRTASLNGARLLRQTEQGVQEISVPLKKILEAKAPDLPMLKGDILFVPSSAAKAAAYRGTEAVMSMTTALTILAVQ